MKYLIKLVLCSALLIASAFFAGTAWLSDHPSRAPPPEPICPPELPAGLDPQRVVVLDLDGSLTGLQRAVFLEDLEELLLAGRYQVVPAASAAGKLPSTCWGWRVEVRWTAAAGTRGHMAAGALRIKRMGEPVEVATTISETNGEALHLALREAIASRLAIAAAGRSPSLHDVQSPGFRERLLAMRSAAEGRLGESAEILRQAVRRDEADTALRFRLGSVLVSWGDMVAAASRSPWNGIPAPLEDPGRRLFEEAALHLARAHESEGSPALALTARGRVFAALGQSAAAEADFSSALETWPACGEAARDLAQLDRARGGFGDLEKRLQDTLLLVDPRKAALRADLLLSLGRFRLSRGNPRLAAIALEEALALVPAERRAFRAEILTSLSEARTASAAKK